MSDADHQTTPPPATGRHPGAAPNLFRLVIRGDGPQRSVTLLNRSYLLGRSDECDIRLDDPSASRRHLLLETRRDGVAFRDLGGTNGTLLNGQPLTEGVAQPGDVLVVGITKVEVEHGSQRPHVRLLASQQTTAVLALGADSRAAAITESGAPPAGSEPGDEQVHLTLDVLGWPWRPSASLDEVGYRLLRAALQLTGRACGLLGVYEPRGPLRVLALQQAAEDRDVQVSREAVEGARIQRTPMLVHVDGDTPHEQIEQVVAPFGARPDGVLVLQSPLPGACDGRAALRIASAFGPIIARELAASRTARSLRDELEQLRFTRTSGYQNVVSSNRLTSLRRRLSEAAQTGLPVRLHAEEGTEREELARYYHARSQHASGPFVPYYCGLVPSHLAASRLLRSDAEVVDADDVPLVEQAVGGTLFLDSPERLSAEVQRMLAATLAELRSRRARGAHGEPGADETLSVVIAETEPGALTAELAAQLDGPTLSVPPLRGHQDDIAALVEATLNELVTEPGGSSRTVTEKALRALCVHDWPGNVRQLQRVVESAAARRHGDALDVRDLPPEIRDAEKAAPSVPTLQEVERRHLTEILAWTGGNRVRAAQLLGIANSTLYDKLRRHGLSD